RRRRGRPRGLLLERVLPRRQSRALLAAQRAPDRISASGALPYHVRVRRRGVEDALPHQCAPTPRCREAHAPAAFGRDLRDAGRRAGIARAQVRRLIHLTPRRRCNSILPRTSGSPRRTASACRRPAAPSRPAPATYSRSSATAPACFACAWAPT